MSMREALASRPKLSAAIAGGVLLLALYLIARPFLPNWGSSGPPAPPPEMWFYEASTGKLVVRQVGGMGFRQGRPGGAGASSGASAEGSAAGTAGGPDALPPGLFRAHVFACGSCDDAQAQFTGLIEQRVPREGRPGGRWGGMGGTDSNFILGLMNWPGEVPLPDRIQGIQLARPSAQPDWVDIDSSSVQGLLDDLRSACPKEKPIQACRPKRP